jgi:Ca-activated chloride channel family protein
VLRVGGLLALAVALLDPRWGVSFTPVQQRGVDLVVVLDVSRSMLAEDVRPNRLERSKQFIRDLVEQLGGDRVALVTFAGTATIKCPLTVDYAAFRLALDLATTESAPRGGSLLGDALRVASESFTDDIPDHKAVVVFTDGEDHGSYPQQAAERLRDERGTPVSIVAIGDADEGARIPVTVDGQRVYLTHDGEEVWSRMNGTLLREVALATGGAYVPVGTGTVDMNRLYEERIEPIATREFEATSKRRYTPRFQWFAGLALGLLLVESFLGDRRGARARVAASGATWRRAA